MHHLRNAPCFLFLIAACLVSAALGAPVPPGKDAPLIQHAAGSAARTRALAVELACPVKFEGFDDPRTTVEEALDHLGKRHELDFDINEAAFKAEGMAKVAEVRIADEMPLPQRPRVRLDMLLQKVLSRVSVPSGATFILRRDHIEITTQAALRREFGLRDGQPLLPLVYVNFDQRSLKEVVRELSEASGVDVVIDSRLTDQSKVPVSATFTGVPVDTAVRLAADAAGLQSVLVNKVLYVTKSENAVRLLADQSVPRPAMARIADELPKKPAPKCGLCDIIQRSRLNPVPQP